MNVDAWLAAAVSDAERRGLGALKPMLETLARSLASLRAADEEHRALEHTNGKPPQPPQGPAQR